MNRPDKAGEPSMEEILASIRQIIADDPSADRLPPVIEANPLVPQSSTADRKVDTRKSETEAALPPQIDRLSGVLKNGALPPTSPLGSKKPLSFDQDLADMFDELEPSNSSVSAAPKPEIRVAPELTSSFGSKMAAPSHNGGETATNGSSFSAPQIQVTPPTSAPASAFGVSDTAADAPPPPPRSFGFPPLRKQGFFPPQKTPTLPPIPAAEPSLNGSSAAPAASDAASAEPVSLDEALKRISGLGAVVPGNIAPTAANGSGSFGAPASSLGLEPAASPASPFTSSPSPALSTPASYHPGFSDPASEASLSKPVAPVVEEKVEDSKPFVAPLASTPFSARPFGETLNGASAKPAARTEPAFTADPATTFVAAQALDALAQGLAASAATSASSPAPQPEIPLVTPVIEPARVAPTASNSLTPASAFGGVPGRTLEDAVADMLRPMLQQWVADNMPRIIERALRTEVAKTTKPGSNSSGS